MICEPGSKRHLAKNICSEKDDNLIILSDPPHLLKKLRYEHYLLSASLTRLIHKCIVKRICKMNACNL